MRKRAGGRTEGLERYDDLHLRFLGSKGLIHEALRAAVT